MAYICIVCLLVLFNDVIRFYDENKMREMSVYEFKIDW